MINPFSLFPLKIRYFFLTTPSQNITEVRLLAWSKKYKTMFLLETWKNAMDYKQTEPNSSIEVW
jgi:hypothetical protein